MIGVDILQTEVPEKYEPHCTNVRSDAYEFP